MQQGRRETRQGHLIGAHCPGNRVLAQLLDQVFLTNDDPGLGAAEQFITGKAHQVRTRRQRFHHSGFMFQPVLGRIQQRT